MKTYKCGCVGGPFQFCKTHAAAPDLLAVLKKINDRIGRWYRFGIAAGPKGKDADFKELKAEIFATIAKAEGK